MPHYKQRCSCTEELVEVTTYGSQSAAIEFRSELPSSESETTLQYSERDGVVCG